ncbi:protein farnesyltransferase subunit beta-like [Dioscorea cayenensis subsp. rotundata]|uniref:Protein farnesyltransferase subunit beta-like n=1 Tax=Dioscorea cayennensis subsp. rotundata TaxID=55577 RepID=A0AB40ALR5_DIOCR|nr:protein farnesyltransferase subunit beta-like [Dioscorea cayenensis subsp. rotundata]
MPHLATTYAAVNTLVTLGSERAFSSIDRGKMYEFLLRMKDASGAFRMHDGGEIDVRACYTAVSVASMLNILDSVLIKDVGNFIWRFRWPLMLMWLTWNGERRPCEMASWQANHDGIFFTKSKISEVFLMLHGWLHGISYHLSMVCRHPHGLSMFRYAKNPDK